MAEENKNINEKLDKAVSDIYNYIKYVEEKSNQNDKTLKFVTSLQTEQMKELIETKRNELRKFFEEAIRLQTEIVRNTYEDIISELKFSYQEEIKSRDLENQRINNQKAEAVKNSYENQITNLIISKDNECNKKILECNQEAQSKFDKTLSETIQRYEAEMSKRCEESYNNGKRDTESWFRELMENELKKQAEEYEKKIAEIKEINERESKSKIAETQEWNDKNLEEKLRENSNFYEAEMSKRCEESYNNGKTDTESWFRELMENELKKQAEEYEQKIAETEERKDEEYAQKIAEIKEKNIQEYKDRVQEVQRWNDKKLEEKLRENSNFYEAEMTRRCEESYNNGKAEIQSEYEGVIAKELQIQAKYFDKEIDRIKQETKAQMYEEMDEAAKRNEEELKIFLDYYEGKMKPFKRLINFHENTNRQIKDIQRRIKNKINKTMGRREAIVPPEKIAEYKIKDKIYKIPNTNNK